jgi:hypothetical protein
MTFAPFKFGSARTYPILAVGYAVIGGWSRSKGRYCNRCAAKTSRFANKAPHKAITVRLVARRQRLVVSGDVCRSFDFAQFNHDQVGLVSIVRTQCHAHYLRAPLE